MWGDVLLALDFTVHPPERWQLQHFAAELALNVSQSVLAESQKRVHFGVVLFGQDVSYFPLPVDEAKLNNLVLDPELGAQVSPRPPRYTHEALSLCESVLTGRYAQVQVVVILTNGLSADPVLTRRSAQDLHARQVRLFSVGMDNVSDRQSVRWMELEDLTLKQYDAFYVNDFLGNDTNDSAQNDTNERRLMEEPVPITLLASILGMDLMEVLLPQPSPPAEPPEGMAPGFIVLIVLGSICCLCSMVGVFYFVVIQNMSKAHHRKVQPQSRPLPVVPTPGPATPRPPLPVPRAPQRPLDPTEKALLEAIEAEDLRKLRVLLSEVLLKGWPDAKHTEMVLKALDAVQKLRPVATRALREAIEDRNLRIEALVADARLAGVEDHLIRQAETLRIGNQRCAASEGTLM